MLTLANAHTVFPSTAQCFRITPTSIKVEMGDIELWFNRKGAGVELCYSGRVSGFEELYVTDLMGYLAELIPWLQGAS